MGLKLVLKQAFYVAIRSVDRHKLHCEFMSYRIKMCCLAAFKVTVQLKMYYIGSAAQFADSFSCAAALNAAQQHVSILYGIDS